MGTKRLIQHLNQYNKLQGSTELARVGADNNFSCYIDSDKVSGWQEFKELIDWFLDGGKLHLSWTPAKKQTESARASYWLEKGKVRTYVGTITYPAQRKSRARRSKSNSIGSLLGELIVHQMSVSDKEKLAKKKAEGWELLPQDKSLLLYAAKQLNYSDQHIESIKHEIS